jgi:hypothetical protein
VLSLADLINSARQPLTQFLARRVRTENEWEKVHLYGEAVLNHLYYQREQYVQLSPGLDSIEYKKIGDELRPGQRAHDLNPFIYDYILPVFKGDVDKIVALLGTRSPGVKASPVIPGDPDQVLLSRIANKVSHYFHKHWNADAVTQTLVHMLCLSGTVFGHVSWNPDRMLYGVTQGPQVVDREVPEFPPYFQCYQCGRESSQEEVQAASGRCPHCEAQLGPADKVESSQTIPGAEVSQSMGQSYPNAACELGLCSVLTVDVPYHTRTTNTGNMLANCDWLKYEYYTRLWDVLARHKAKYAGNDDASMPIDELMRKIGVSPTTGPFSSDNRGPRADERLSTPSKSDYTTSGRASGSEHKVLYTALYVHPKLYEELPGDQSGEIRESLAAHCPDGCELTWANGFLVDIDPCMLARRWTACKPGTSEWVYCEPYFSEYREGVDVANDFLNIVIQAGEYSIGEIAYDQEIVDPEYLRDHAADFGTWLPVRPTSGRQLADHFFRIPGARMDETLVKFLTFFVETLREARGVRPELFGGGDVEQTARGSEIRRNQALIPHNTLWNSIRRFLSEARENGAYLAAERSGGQLYLSSRGPRGVAVIDVPNIQSLLAGGWSYTASEGLPMTPGMRRDWIMDLLQNPQSQVTFSIVDREGALVPQNLPLLHEAAGLDDWHIQDLEAYNGLLERIQQLVQMEPVEAPGPDGAPFMDSPLWKPYEPMIYPPELAIKTLRGWLQKEGRELEGTPGWLAVVAHLSRYVNYMQEQQMAAMMAQAGPAGELEAGPAGPQ